MCRDFRTLLVKPMLFAAVILVLSQFTLAQIVSAQNSPVHWTPFLFTSAAGDTLSADSARVVVPENRQRPTGATISIAVIRIRTTSAAPRSPIIYLAGGPGGSGIAGARGDLFPTVVALRTVSDVILFDQRGTGVTQPSLGIRSTFGVPLTISSASPEAKRALIAASEAAVRDVKSRGIDLSSYNTVENANDIDDIRKALGATKLIVWGHSYGSHLGFAYLRQFPAHAERAILGGINGPDHRRRYPKDADVLFTRIDSIVRATPKLRTVMPDFLGSTKRVFASLAKNPVTVRVDSQDVLVTKEDVQAVIAIQSGEQAFVRRLPWYVGRMEAGDYSAMARLVRDVIKSRPMGTAMTYAMDLASGVSVARAERIRSEAPTAILGNAINYPFDDADFQAAWSPVDLGAAFRAPVKSSVPTMFISGTLDGRTSLADAREVRSGFKTSAFVVVNGASHNPYAVNVALRDAMLRFVKGESLPDTVIRLSNVEVRGPDESELIAELQKASLGGASAAAERLRELSNDATHYVSSFVVIGAVQALAPSNREAAAAVLMAGLEIFPNNTTLLVRLGDMQLARGEIDNARASYQRAIVADPFNQVASVQLSKRRAQ